MNGKEVNIKIKTPGNYFYVIHLFYDNDEEMYKNFLNPLNKAKQNCKDIVLSASQGMIKDNYRHFKTDYVKYKYFEMIVPGKNVSFSNVNLSFEEDVERNMHVEYDSWNIKNLTITIHD